MAIENPVAGGSFLYDQGLEGLALDEGDFISREQFDEMWKRNMGL